MKKIILLTVLSAIYISIFAQTRYYVDLNASGQNTGVSWSDAFNNLHDAMVVAISGDEIWVAEGTYHPSENIRTVYYSLLSGVQLYGSFSGSEMLAEERDIEAHPTILDGDIGIAGDSLDNTYNLLYLFHPDSTTLVDGFTFRDGQADKLTGGTGGFGNSGAAILINGNNSFAYLTIRNCNFEDNYSRYDGGAVCITSGTTGDVGSVFENCRFESNHSQRKGGAVYESGGSIYFEKKGFTNCIFLNNYAKLTGGALSFVSLHNNNVINITRCIFKNNFTSLPDGSLRASCINLSNPQSNLTYLKITESVFDDKNRYTITSDLFDAQNSHFYFSLFDSKFNNSRDINQLISSDFIYWETNTLINDTIGINRIEKCNFIMSGISRLTLSESKFCLINNSVFKGQNNLVRYTLNSNNLAPIICNNNIFTKSNENSIIIQDNPNQFYFYSSDIFFNNCIFNKAFLIVSI